MHRRDSKKTVNVFAAFYAMSRRFAPASKYVCSWFTTQSFSVESLLNFNFANVTDSMTSIGLTPNSLLMSSTYYTSLNYPWFDEVNSMRRDSSYYFSFNCILCTPRHPYLTSFVSTCGTKGNLNPDAPHMFAECTVSIVWNHYNEIWTQIEVEWEMYSEDYLCVHNRSSYYSFRLSNSLVRQICRLPNKFHFSAILNFKGFTSRQAFDTPWYSP